MKFLFFSPRLCLLCRQCRDVYKTRVILILSLAIIAIPTLAPAQSTASSAYRPPGPDQVPPMPADGNPSFDVATIKPSDTSAQHGTFFRTNDAT
jgi:hypothetical protein